MSNQLYMALIGDFVDSREMTVDARHQLQKKINSYLGEVRIHKQSGVATQPLVTLGDEFQALFHASDEGARSLLNMISDIFDLASPTAVRYGIGIGTLSTRIQDKALGMDGPCFHRARIALDNSRSFNLLCQLVIEGGAVDSLWGTLASYALLQRQGWTKAQREAIALYSQLGAWNKVANTLKISTGAVSLRQQAAGWSLYNTAWHVLEKGLDQIMRDKTGYERNPEGWVEVLDAYPLLKKCFENYLRWIAQQQNATTDDNDLISIIEANRCDRLKKLEGQLTRSRDFLNMSDTQFQRCFFNQNMMTVDSEQIHDALAEPIFVLDLAEHGFTQITILPKPTKGRLRHSSADFIAVHTGKRYAIELKSIRPENNPKPRLGVPSGNAAKSYWWGEMFRSNVLTKIHAKDQRAITQLQSTARTHACDYIILAIYTRRLGPSTLMETDDYIHEIEIIKKQFNQIDHFIVKDYFGNVVIYPPIN